MIVIDAELCLLALIPFGLFIPASEAESFGKVVHLTICSRTMSHPKAMFFGNAPAENFDARRRMALRPSRYDGDFSRSHFYVAFKRRLLYDLPSGMNRELQAIHL